MSQTKRLIEEMSLLDIEVDMATQAARAKRKFNSDTTGLFCSSCGKCKTAKDIPTDVLGKVGTCSCQG